MSVRRPDNEPREPDVPARSAVPRDPRTLDLEVFSGAPAYLRPLDHGDLAQVLAWFHGDPDVTRYLRWNTPLNNATSEEKWFADMQSSPRHHVFAIVEAASGSHIGNVGLHEIEPVNQAAEFGVYLAPEWRDQGLGAAAIIKVLRWAFDVRNLHRVGLETWEFNDRGSHLYERLGFRPEGVRREAHYLGGRFWDVHLYGLLADEFRARYG